MGKCLLCGQETGGTFESSQRRYGGKKQSMAAAIPEVGSTNVHHHGTPWPAIIATSVVCGVALLPVGWGVGVFLLDRADFKEPERALAGGILILGIGLPVLYVGSWLLERIPRMIIRELADWNLQKEEIDLQKWKVKALAGQASVPTAANLDAADVRFVRVVKQVVGNIFIDRIGKDNLYTPYKPKEPRPWSRDVCKETVLLWDRKKIGWRDANRLGKYIVDNEIIFEGQLNQGRYPTMDAVNDLLDKEFTRSIVVNPSPTQAQQKEVSFIENA